jgi:hypothetical protein
MLTKVCAQLPGATMVSPASATQHSLEATRAATATYRTVRTARAGPDDVGLDRADERGDATTGFRSLYVGPSSGRLIGNRGTIR